MGDRVSLLVEAVERVGRLPETTVVAVSSVWDTEPAYFDDQPSFANMAIVIDTELSPHELLAHLMMIETDLGRLRQFPNSPRTVDVDILLYGDKTIASDLLVVPHPRMLERDFVVTPLLEIAPGISLPDGTSVDRSQIAVGRCTSRLADAGSLSLSCYNAGPS